MPSGIEAVQFVAFLSAPLTDNANVWWPRLFSAPVAAFSTTGFVSTAAAPISNLQVQLQVQPTRVDLIATPIPPATPPHPSTPPLNLPDLQSALTELGPAMDRLCQQAAAVRLACVVQGAEVVSSEAAALTKLNTLLALPLKAGAADVSLQINVRKASSAQPGLDLNRLCRWGTAMLLTMQFQVSMVPGAVQSAPLGPTSHAMTFYIDINTPPNVAVDPARIGAILDELAGEADVILKGGYGAL